MRKVSLLCDGDESTWEEFQVDYKAMESNQTKIGACWPNKYNSNFIMFLLFISYKISYRVIIM